MTDNPQNPQNPNRPADMQAGYQQAIRIARPKQKLSYTPKVKLNLPKYSPYNRQPTGEAPVGQWTGQSYWQDPQRIARAALISRAMPPGYNKPEWLDPDTEARINASYNYLSQTYGNEWWNWGHNLPDDDPLKQEAAAWRVPNELIDAEAQTKPTAPQIMALYGITDDDLVRANATQDDLVNSFMGIQSQLNYTPAEVHAPYDVDEEWLATVRATPEDVKSLDITGLQPIYDKYFPDYVRSTKSADAMRRYAIRFGAANGIDPKVAATLPLWQFPMIALFRTTGGQVAQQALNFGIMGYSLGGTAGALLAGGAMGGLTLLMSKEEEKKQAALAAGQEYDANKALRVADAAFWVLNQAFEGLETTFGMQYQVQQALVDMVKGRGTGELEDIFNNLPAAVEASRIYWDTALPQVQVLENMAQGEGAYFEQWELGKPEPKKIEVDPQIGVTLGAMRDIRKSLAAGYSMREIMAMWGDRLKSATMMKENDPVFDAKRTEMGFIGELGELAAGYLFDPLDISGRIVNLAGANIADMKGNKVLSFAYRVTNGPVDAIKTYGALLRTGALPGTPTAKQIGGMGAFTRMLAGVDEAGNPAKGATSPIGRIFGLNRESLAYETMTSSASALQMAINEVDNVPDIVKLISGLARYSPELAAEISGRMPWVDSPDGASFAVSLREYKDTLTSAVAVWEAGTENRVTWQQINKALGKDNVALLADARKNGAASIIAALEKAVTNNPKANQALAQKMQAGILTADTLTGMLDAHKNGAFDLNLNEFKGRAFVSMFDTIEKWAVEYYGIKPDSPLTRFFQSIKEAQSFALLGFNPIYFLNNLLSNRVTMAWQGVFGLRSRADINLFWENIIGFTPIRVDAGIGGVAGLGTDLDIERLKFNVGGQIRNAKRVEGGLLTAFSDFMSSDVMSKAQVATRLSQHEERAASRQAFTAGAMKALPKFWQVGVGFDRMPGTLVNGLRKIDPKLPEMFYSMIAGNPNPKNLYKALFEDINQRNIDAVVFDAVENMRAAGMTVDDEKVRTTLNDVGVLDFLTNGLLEAQTREEIINVNDTALEMIQTKLDDMARKAIGDEAAAASAKAVTEGVAGALEYFDHMWHDQAQFWSDHFEDWQTVNEEAAALDKTAKNARYNAQRAASRREWARMQSVRDAAILGTIRGLDAGDTVTNDIGIRLEYINAVWGEYFNTVDRLQRDFWSRDFPSKEARSDAWNQLEDDLARMYVEALAKEETHQKEIDSQFADTFARQTRSDPKIAQAWRDNARDIRTKMGKRMSEFRKSLSGMSGIERRAAWTKFIDEEYNPTIQKLTAANMSKALEMYRASGPVKGSPTIVRPKILDIRVKLVEAGISTEGNWAAILPELNSLLEEGEAPFTREDYSISPSREKLDLLDTVLARLEEKKAEETPPVEEPTPEAPKAEVEEPEPEPYDGTTDRRQELNKELRAAWDSMEADEQFKAHFLDDKTGIYIGSALKIVLKNKIGAAELPYLVYLDGEGLGWWNEGAGDRRVKDVSGDELIAAIARAIMGETQESYRVHSNGDEYVMRFPSREAAEEAIARASGILKNTPIDVEYIDGHKESITGANFFYGIGKANYETTDLNDLVADAKLDYTNKKDAAKEAGTYVDKGKKPIGIMPPIGKSSGLSEPLQEAIIHIEQMKKILYYRAKSAEIMDMADASSVRLMAIDDLVYAYTKAGRGEKEARAEVAHAVALVDAHAELWAKKSGRTAADWWTENVAGVMTSEQFINEYGPDMEKRAKGAQAAVAPVGERNLIAILSNPDAATLPHELAHIFRRELEIGDIDTLLTEMDSLYGYKLGYDAGTGKFTGDAKTIEDAEEAFALGFELYLREGKAPSPGLQGVFDKFKTWLKAIYKSLKTGGMKDVKLSDPMRDIYNRLLAEPPAPEVEAPYKSDAYYRSEPTGSTVSYIKNGATFYYGRQPHPRKLHLYPEWMTDQIVFGAQILKDTMGQFRKNTYETVEGGATVTVYDPETHGTWYQKLDDTMKAQGRKLDDHMVTAILNRFLGAMDEGRIARNENGHIIPADPGPSYLVGYLYGIILDTANQAEPEPRLSYAFEDKEQAFRDYQRITEQYPEYTNEQIWGEYEEAAISEYIDWLDEQARKDAEIDAANVPPERPAQVAPERFAQIAEVANRFGIPSAKADGTPETGFRVHVANIMARYMPEKYAQGVAFETIDPADLEIAMTRRAAAKEQPAPVEAVAEPAPVAEPDTPINTSILQTADIENYARMLARQSDNDIAYAIRNEPEQNRAALQAAIDAEKAATVTDTAARLDAGEEVALEDAIKVTPEIEEEVRAKTAPVFGRPQGPKQTNMFTNGEDLPIFSGTAQRAREEVFNPAQADTGQDALFNTREYLPTIEGKEVQGTGTGEATPLLEGMGEAPAPVEAAPATPAPEPDLIQFGDDDISLDVAIRAYNGTSWDPETRGASARKRYTEHVRDVQNRLRKYADTPEKLAQLTTALESYKAGYLARYREYLGARQGLVSAWIAGPSKFPSDRMNKKSESIDNKMNALIEWSEKAQKRIVKDLRPDLGVISSDNPDAPNLLQAKVDKLEATQAEYRAINKIVKKKGLTDDQKVAQIVAELGYKETSARKLLEPDFAGRIGVPDYMLANNSAEIRRLKARITDIGVNRATQNVDRVFDGGRIVENAEENRIQILFDAKPDEATRTKLKANGFVWAPSKGAWQRQLNNGSRNTVRGLFPDAKPIEAPTATEAPSAIADDFEAAIPSAPADEATQPGTPPELPSIDDLKNGEVLFKRRDIWDIGSIEQEYKSERTSINSSKLPATFNRIDVKQGDVIADIGGGRFDNAERWAAERGATLHVIDPFNRTRDQNARAIAAVRNGRADIVTVNNTLNVIRETENRRRVIEQAANALKPGGTAYFLIYEGNQSGIGAASQQGASWQNNTRAAAYLNEIKSVFGSATIKNGMIQAKKTNAGILFKRADPTNTPEFRRWFGESKVVDEEGQPLVVYHGTMKKFQSFNIDEAAATRESGLGTDPGFYGDGFYFSTNTDTANRYADPNLNEFDKWNVLYDEQPAPNVKPVYLRITNPVTIDFASRSADRKPQPEVVRKISQYLPQKTRVSGGLLIDTKDLTIEGLFDLTYSGKILGDAIRSAGYDGVIINYFGEKEIVAFSPTQIKSTFNQGTFDPGNPNILFKRKDQNWYYSQLERTLETMPAKITPEALRGFLRGKVKADELAWTGFDEWLDAQTGTVTREAALEYLDANRVEVEEVTKPGFEQTTWYLYNGEQRLGSPYRSEEEALQVISELFPDRPEFSVRPGELQSFERPKYSTYVLPGGENYRELILYTPKIEPYVPDNIHFTDVGGGRAISWIRFNDRIDADGKRVFFIEEIQSKRHQEGRVHGYKRKGWFITSKDSKSGMQYTLWNENVLMATDDNLDRLRRDSQNTWKIDDVPMVDLKTVSDIPPAPFSDSWEELTMKRAIRWAAENGYERIAWTTGAMQGERWNLSKQVKAIQHTKTERGDYSVYIIKKGSTDRALIGNGLTESELVNNFGKEVSDRIIAGEGESIPYSPYKSLSGFENLTVGDKGMKGFYDVKLVNIANKLLKRLGGGEVGEARIYGGGQTVVKKWKVITQEAYDTVPRQDWIILGDFTSESDAAEYAKKRPNYIVVQVDDTESAKVPVHAFDVTEQMRQSAMQGQPLFKKRAGTRKHISVRKVKDGQAFGGFNIRAGVYYTDPQGASRLVAFLPERYNVGQWQKNDQGDYRILGLDPDNENNWVIENRAGKLEKIPRAKDNPTAVNAPIGTADSLNAQPPVYKGMQEYYNKDVKPIMQAIREASLKTETGVRVPGMERLNDGTPEMKELMRELKAYTAKVQGQSGGVRLAAAKVGEIQRDMALLNYTKRYGFDNLLTAIMPYQFWYTRSVANWAARFIDKPSIIANYGRLRAMQERHTREGFPTRLNGKVGIPLPFLPEGAGDAIYIDPQRIAFPFENFATPFSRLMQQDNRNEKAAKSIIYQWMEDGTTSEADGTAAMNDKKGDLWERALEEAVTANDQDIANPLDFMNVMSGFSLPINIIYQNLRGTPNKLSPLPFTRLIQAAGGLAGVDPELIQKASKITSLGLPANDNWQDYRIDRELANMTADGMITADEAKRAMIDRTGDVFEAARRRLGKQQGIKYLFAAFMSDLYPEGEQTQRALTNEYYRAIDVLENGDTKALTKFYDAHPEYEARVAQMQDPEERLRRFLIAEVWGRYKEQNPAEKRAYTKDFGENFELAFLDSNTRDYSAIDTNTLAWWANSLGANMPKSAPDTPGVVTPEMPPTVQQYYDEMEAQFPNNGRIWDMYYKMDAAGQAQLRAAYPQLDAYTAWKNKYLATHPEVIQYVTNDNAELAGLPMDIQSRVYTYRALRDERYPGIFEIQDGYYAIPEDQRKAYKKEYPELEEYWDWRRSYAAAYPKASPWIMSEESLSNAITGQYGDAEQLTNEQLAEFSPALMRALLAAKYAGDELRSGMESELYKHWQDFGEPGGDYDTWVQDYVYKSLE